MNLPEGAIVKIITADTPLAAYIGNRIYPHPAPKGTAYPFISYQRISVLPRHHLSGRSSLSGVRIQMDVWAKDFTTCGTVAELAQNAVDAYRGVENNLDIQWISLADEEGGGISFDEALAEYRCTFEIVVTYTREKQDA